MPEITVQYGPLSCNTITMTIPSTYDAAETTSNVNVYLAKNPLTTKYSMRGYGELIDKNGICILSYTPGGCLGDSLLTLMGI